jgi:hypothetical protein
MIHSLTSTTLDFSSCYTPVFEHIAGATIPIINIMSEAERPKVGVGVVIHDGAGNIIMGERAGSHGAGTTYLNFSPLSKSFETIHDRSLACKAFVTNLD